MRWAAREGSPFPQGVTWIPDERAYNFSLYSKHAERVTLLVYGPGDLTTPLLSQTLESAHNKTGRIWHCRVPEEDIEEAFYYGYSVDGPAPDGPFEWHHFDREKILLDPYAQRIYFPPSFDRSSAVEPGSNAGKAPLGVLCSKEPSVYGRGDERLRHEADTIIYELHVRGFTQHPSSGVSPERRGTYLGLTDKIPYLKELGVTAVELLPVFQFDPQEGNYWGYMPIHFFAPHHAYAVNPDACEQHDEFREMVEAFHRERIEVILDVVYNHTGEGDHQGPVYSFKGLDNSTYYMMSGRPEAPYANFAGTGNTLHCANRYVRKMILDSLRYWAEEMHVDGYRFDLASVFTRKSDGTIDPDDPGIFAEIVSDPRLTKLRLIAEPWDAAGAYHLGRSLPGITWFQWNGQFRDDVRRFVRSDAALVPALMYRLYGSDDLFPDDRMHAYHPYQSVNYVTSHDGFTLNDLVSYNERNNWANGHGNTDGANDNYSWNCGWEGEENVPGDVIRLRKRQVKNFCALLLLSNGTPMIRAGDEFLQTQDGNNNPYNQDNETSWLDWRRLETHRDIFRFFKHMIAFRKAHPTLCRSRFWRDDVRWYGVGPSVDTSHASRSLAFYLDGRSEEDVDLYVLINAHWKELSFAIQEGGPGDWKRVADTSVDSPGDFYESGQEEALASSTYLVSPHSIVVLIRNGQHTNGGSPE